MAYGEKAPQATVVGLTDRRALEAWRPADEAVIARARRYKEEALLDFGMELSVIASWLYTKCHHHIPTTAIDTAAVMASGDGTCLLLYNPTFFCELGLDGVKFVLFHEARHLIQRHLFAESELRADPVFTLAAEVTINHVAMTRLGRTTLPTLRRVDLHCLAWEDVVETIAFHDPVAGQFIDSFYGKCLRFNRPRERSAFPGRRSQTDTPTPSADRPDDARPRPLPARRGHPRRLGPSPR